MLDRKYGINVKKTNVLEKETKNRIHLSLKSRQVIDEIKLPTIIAGDFNMPIESIIYRSHWGDLLNSYSETGHGYGWSVKDFLKNVYIKIRVDHVLTNHNATPLNCEVVKTIGSDHLPVISDIMLTD